MDDFFHHLGNGKSSQLTFTPSFCRGGKSTTNQRRIFKYKAEIIPFMIFNEINHPDIG
jgi:hypothetical protein